MDDTSFHVSGAGNASPKGARIFDFMDVEAETISSSVSAFTHRAGHSAPSSVFICPCGLQIEFKTAH